MKRWLWLQFLLVVAFSNNSFAQDGLDATLRGMEVQRLQMEAQTARMRAEQAESDRMQAESDRMIDRIMSERAAQEAADIAEQAAAEQAESAKKAEEAAEELRDEMDQAAVRTKNNIYLGALIFITAGLVTYIIRKSKKEEIMHECQKFGIATIIGSILVIVIAVMISDGWVFRVDFLQNIMSLLRIQFFEGDYNSTTNLRYYYVDIPTKYVVLVCICVAAYGLTTYLGITPVPKRKMQKADCAVSDKSL